MFIGLDQLLLRFVANSLIVYRYCLYLNRKDCLKYVLSFSRLVIRGKLEQTLRKRFYLNFMGLKLS